MLALANPLTALLPVIASVYCSCLLHILNGFASASLQLLQEREREGERDKSMLVEPIKVLIVLSICRLSHFSYVSAQPKLSHCSCANPAQPWLELTLTLTLASCITCQRPRQQSFFNDCFLPISNLFATTPTMPTPEDTFRYTCSYPAAESHPISPQSPISQLMLLSLYLFSWKLNF